MRASNSDITKPRLRAPSRSRSGGRVTRRVRAVSPASLLVGRRCACRRANCPLTKRPIQGFDGCKERRELRRVVHEATRHFFHAVLVIDLKRAFREVGPMSAYQLVGRDAHRTAPCRIKTAE